MSIALVAALALSAADVSRSTGDVGLQGGATRLNPKRFGGVTAVIRYTVAEPDRDDTAYVFLTGPARVGGLPSEAPVLASDGSQVRVKESQGDCTLAHVELRSTAAAQGEIVYAARTFSGDLKTDVNSEPASCRSPSSAPSPPASPEILRSRSRWSGDPCTRLRPVI